MVATAISARNQLTGIVQSIEHGGVMGKVIFDLEGVPLTSIVVNDSIEELGVKIGDSIKVIIKATSVMILKDGSAQISGRNKIPCQIESIQKGGVVAKVVLNFKGNILNAIIDNQSVDDLNLQTNDDVIALVKSTNVMLLK